MRRFIDALTESQHMLTLECTARSYAVEVEVDAFVAMTRAEDTRGFPASDCLDYKLGELGCEKIEYNGHFGNYIYFTLSAEDDNDALHQQIIQTIQEHMQKIA